MEEEIKKWWDETSKSYQKSTTISTNSAHYGPYAPNENNLNLLGKVKGKRILEIGCGGGQCSIAFAKQGAVCTGIDISKEQLKHAKDLAEKNNVKVNFILGNFQNLNRIKSKSMDIVFSAYALQYSPDLKKVFLEISRVLKKKGLFVFSLENPLYPLIDPKTKKIRSSYLDTGRKELNEDLWHKGAKNKFIYYKFKLSDIYNNLVSAGFFVEKILEPFSLEERQWTTGIWKKFYSKELANLIGPTIIFKSVKR